MDGFAHPRSFIVIAEGLALAEIIEQIQQSTVLASIFRKQKYVCYVEVNL
jgi:hypothetical protein